MKLVNKGIYILSFLLLSIPFACTEEDDFSIIEGLNFTVATLNAEGTKTGVLPTTVPGDGRIVYTVDFGDPNAENDDDVFQTSGPMVDYTYPKESATYTIKVTAKLDGKEDVTITKKHAVVYVVDKPTTPASPLVGTWKLAPEAGAIGVGPALNDISWWSNSAGDVTTRACLFDDKYVFNDDGSFQNIVGTETWVETWQGATAEGCAAPVFPHDGTATATYTYSGTSIKISGKGAYLGLAKAFNGGELAAPADAKDEITYIAALSADGNTLELDIEIAGGGHWSFKLVKELPPAIEGTWKLAPEAGAIGVGPALNDLSWWSNSAGDVTTRACLFDDEYVFNADGTFENVVGTETWVETWQGAAAEGCAAPVFPHDGTATATYTYDETAKTIKISGKGAYLGLAKAFNGGELAAPADAKDEITYMAELSADGNTLELDIEIAGGGHWSFKLVKEAAPSSPIQGTWQLAPEAAAIGVGPALNDLSWWSNSAGDLTTRACLFDDEYVFNADGSFENVLGTETWIETWQGATAEGCAAPVFPHDGTASATYTYDASAGTVKISGKGAYLGLAKAFNGGELAAPADAKDDITYMADLSSDGNTLELDIEIAGGGHWSFKLVRK